METQKWIKLSPDDNVVVCSSPEGLRAGASVAGVSLAQDIARGHKVAVAAIAKGAQILKFGHVIGIATTAIAPGEHVHVHNVEMPPTELLDSGPQRLSAQKQAAVPAGLPQSFQGYQRLDGRVGTRNYVVVVASVNCSATVVKAVCRHFSERTLAAIGLDGVVPITHSSGCAQAIGGHGYSVLNRTLAGWVFHPNVVGAVVIGLGCEGTTFKSILAARSKDGSTEGVELEHLSIQDVGGTSKAITEGIAAVDRVLARLPKFERTPQPVSGLHLALNCGGSDAFSSLTANPALGVCSDLLVGGGGTVSLAEIPECTGAEGILRERATGDDVKSRLHEMFKWWDDYAARHKVGYNENLAPGNIAGGITTIVEKSLGAVTKAGTSPLTQVVDYSEPVKKHGFVLMNTPGFDPVSVTGLVAGGANLVAFTTGRGSVYGCAISPTIKIATNSELYERMRDDMDIDAGAALRGRGIAGVGEEIYRFAVAVASGQKPCSETLGLGWEEFAPWPVGETL